MDFLYGERAGDWEETKRTPATAVQGHLQARPESAGHEHRHLGSSRRRQVHLETGSAQGTLSLRREPNAADRTPCSPETDGKPTNYVGLD